MSRGEEDLLQKGAIMRQMAPEWDICRGYGGARVQNELFYAQGGKGAGGPCVLEGL